MGVLDWINTALQGAQTVYQGWAQRKTWQREDTAVQRRVADLKAAGLNPVLAAGSAAQTSSPIQVTAPQVSLETSRQRSQVGVSNAQRELIDAQLANARTQHGLLVNQELVSAVEAEAAQAFTLPLQRAELERRELENLQTGYMLDWYSRHDMPLGSGNTVLGRAATVSDWITDVVERMREHPETMGGSAMGTQGGK